MPNATHKHSKREFDAGHVPITEEFDSPRRRCPPPCRWRLPWSWWLCLSSALRTSSAPSR